jgi:hypothetical protein
MALTRPLVLAIVLSAACGGDDPADVAGTYTIALTNRENGCNLGNWTVGNTTSGVMVDISQNGDAMSADVQGLGGAALDFVLGGHVFTGDVDGTHLDATIVGTKGNTMNACAYTYDAGFAADLTGNTLNGTVIYRARTNAAADCGTLTGCSSRQDFSGARPPQ